MTCAHRPAAVIAASRVLASLLAGSAIAFAGSAAYATPYLQTNLVTDDQAFLTSHGYAPAFLIDRNLVNPWGMSHSGASPMWVSNNGTGTSTLYNIPGTGAAATLNPTVVIIPPPSTVTGQVNTAGTGATEFFVPGVVAPTPGNPTGSGKSGFIFATEGGTIVARTNTTNSITMVNNSTSGAVYKGLAIGQATIGGTTGSFLYAANFHSGKIDVVDSSFNPVSVPAGTFTDPDPALVDYAPFNVQTLNGKLYVTYAKRDPINPDEDDPGAGNGFVDVFNLDGTNRQRVASGGILNSPWGLDIAPASFGEFSNDLLVGNFGDGTINVFNPVGFSLLGTLHDLAGNPIVIEGLWGLINGNGGNGGELDHVYFAAGIGDEEHGLFGSLAVLPEPSTLAIFGVGLLGLGFLTRRRVLAAE